MKNNSPRIELECKNRMLLFQNESSENFSRLFAIKFNKVFCYKGFAVVVAAGVDVDSLLLLLLLLVDFAARKRY